MRIILAFFLLFTVSCSDKLGESKSSDGDNTFAGVQVETCSAKGLRASLSIENDGEWTYAYKGKKYFFSIEKLNKGIYQNVRHLSEKVLSLRCRNKIVIYKQSLRRIALLDETGRAIYEGELLCHGNSGFSASGSSNPADQCSRVEGEATLIE